jgi:hypothetical protein
MDCENPGVNTILSNIHPATEIITSSPRSSTTELFDVSFSGQFHILVDSINNINIGNLHQVKLGKNFSQHFNGILNITLIGSLRVKVSFDLQLNANACFVSQWTKKTIM